MNRIDGKVFAAKLQRQKEKTFQFRPLALGLACFGLMAYSAQTVLANDDLLSILESQTNPANQEMEQSALTKALSKLIGSPNAEQNIFIQFLANQEVKKALYQWPSAFADSNFAETPSGRALNAYLHFANGLNVTGLEDLLAIGQPNEIAPEILSLWKEIAPPTHNAWSVVQTQTWNSKWSDVFGAVTEIRVRGRRVYEANEISTVKDLLQKASLGTAERAWLQWQAVLVLAAGPDPGAAGKALALLMKEPNNPVSVDLMNITAARLLFQNGYLDAAMKYYEKVPKNSDYWFEAQEEIGWSHVRKGEPQNAIAITKTLIHPNFVSQVGPETVFLRSLALLKVCDYQEVVQTLKLYRERYKGRADVLRSLVQNPDSPSSQRLVASLKKSTVTLESLGGDAAKLPRYVTRDETLKKLVSTWKSLDGEVSTASQLYGDSLTGGTAQVGFQARFEKIKQAVEARQFAARSAALDRVKSLAEEEVGEISQILQKLHIVEAEVIQQLSVAEKIKMASVSPGERKQSKGLTNQGDRIWFPAEKETWFDELANYRVDVKKGCQSLKR